MRKAALHRRRINRKKKKGFTDARASGASPFGFHHFDDKHGFKWHGAQQHFECDCGWNLRWFKRTGWMFYKTQKVSQEVKYRHECGGTVKAIGVHSNIFPDYCGCLRIECVKCGARSTSCRNVHWLKNDGYHKYTAELIRG